MSSSPGNTTPCSRSALTNSISSVKYGLLVSSQSTDAHEPGNDQLLP